MGDKRFAVIFWSALVVAAIATFGAYRLLQARTAGAKVVTRPVVVAAKDVPEGAALDATALTLASWPEQSVPPGAFSRLDSAVGRVVRVSVFAGEAIVRGRLAPVVYCNGDGTPLTGGPTRTASDRVSSGRPSLSLIT